MLRGLRAEATNLPGKPVASRPQAWVMCDELSAMFLSSFIGCLRILWPIVLCYWAFQVLLVTMMWQSKFASYLQCPVDETRCCLPVQNTQSAQSQSPAEGSDLCKSFEARPRGSFQGGPLIISGCCRHPGSVLRPKACYGSSLGLAKAIKAA